MKQSWLSRISIGMPAYNSEAYIAESSESILNQTYENFEFIIADNGLDDGTAGIIQSYAGMDPSLRQKMVGRWEGTRKGSQAFGDECEAVLQKHMAMIKTA